MPCGIVCAARPSRPGVPAGNHEREPREAPTFHQERRSHFPPQPLGVTAAARLSRPGAWGGAGAGLWELLPGLRPPHATRPPPLVPHDAWMRRSDPLPHSCFLKAATQPVDCQ